MEPSFTLWALLCVAAACATNTSDPFDASTDAPTLDGSHDAATRDGAPGDAAVDSPADVTEEPTDDASDDGSSADASEDAPLDAPSDSPITVDSGKGCLGVLCIKGDACCNILTSPDYGKCYSTKCLACCM